MKNEGKGETARLTLEDWILAFLEYADGEVRGKTRLQKALFLVQQEVGGVPAEFRPHKYGPYSADIDNALERLAREGLVEVVEEPGGDESPVQVIRLRPEARERARRALEALKGHPEWGEAIQPAFELAARRPLMALLAYIYTFYPEYTENSLIKAKVRRWRKRRLLGLF